MVEDEDKNCFTVMLPHYSGNPVGLHGEGLSCDQFCEIVESQIETFKWTDQDAFNYAIQAFTSPAQDWAYDLKDSVRTWPTLKKAMKAKFKGKMTIQMKAELRKSLKQNQEESVREFYGRCKDAETMICDDQVLDVAFERDVLLTFLIGLREELQLRVMASEGSCLNDFLESAIKIESNENEDMETDDVKIKPEFFKDENSNDENEDLDDYLNDKDFIPDDTGEEMEDNNVKKEQESEDSKHFCTECEMPFKTEKLLKQHEQREHSDNQSETEKLKCSTCDATFRTSRMLRLHIYKNHSENTKYSCQVCAQDFFDLKKFVLHQIKYHSERQGDQIFCLACRRPYTKSHSLQVHMIRKHYKEKPFPCDQEGCDQKFYTITDVQKHIKIKVSKCAPFISYFDKETSDKTLFLAFE